MLFRILGSLLLVGLSLYGCYSFSLLEEKRVRQTEGFLLLLRYMRTRISCFRTAREDIYASFENRALSECGFLCALRAHGFAAALERMRPQLYLDEEELLLLSSFGEELGQGYSEEEVILCEGAIKEMEQAMEKRRSEAPRRTRVAHSLVMTGGLALVFLLL